MWIFFFLEPSVSWINYITVFSRFAFLYQGFWNIWGKIAEKFAKAMLNDSKPLSWAGQEIHIFLGHQWNISGNLSILLSISSRTLIPVILQSHFLWQLQSRVCSLSVLTACLPVNYVMQLFSRCVSGSPPSPSPENLSERQILRPHFRYAESQTLCFNRPSSCCFNPWTFENHRPNY